MECVTIIDEERTQLLNQQLQISNCKGIMAESIDMHLYISRFSLKEN